MPSLCDTPYEIHCNIELQFQDLKSVVLVNHHLYDTYIQRLYERYWPSSWDLDRYESFLIAVLASPRLGSYVKRIDLDCTWREILLEYAYEKADRECLPPVLETLLRAKDGGPRFFDLCLSHLQQVEHLTIELDSEDTFLQGGIGSRLRSVEFDSFESTPLRFVAAALSLPMLTHLQFRLEPAADPVALAAVPARSSPLQRVVIKEALDAFEPLGPSFPLVDHLAETFKAFLSKVRALRHFRWERTEEPYCQQGHLESCITHHNACLQPALDVFCDSLGTMEIWSRDPMPCCLSLKDDCLASFRSYLIS